MKKEYFKIPHFFRHFQANKDNPIFLLGGVNGDVQTSVLHP